MKTVTKTYALAVLIGLSFQAASAQSDEQVLNSDPIDVDGYMAEKQVTDGELEQIKSEVRKQKNEIKLNKDKSKGFRELVNTTEKLSDTTEEYLDEKASAKDEIAEYNKKIECLTQEHPSKDCAKYARNKRNKEVVTDSVAVAQASAIVQAPAPEPKAFEKIKLLPYAGVTNYMGKVEKLETNMAMGIRLESNIMRRLSMGIGLSYASLTTQDFGSGYGASPYYGYYNGMYGGNGREITMKNMGLDLYAKLFITNGERFRPYVGAGIGYNRMSMNYSGNNNTNYYGMNNNYRFGGEELNSSFISGSLSAGSEVLITQNIGFNIELQMSRGFGADNTSNGLSPYNAPDQKRLQDLSNEIIQANALSIFAGLLVIF
jgi:opacity protein-like surface antigen